MTLTVNDFIDPASSVFASLRWHHFIAKAQSYFLNELKDDLQQNQSIVPDYNYIVNAENYRFIVQDAIQGHHWNNSQVTLHAFAIYFKTKINKLNCRNIFIISDCLKHNANTVYAFIPKIMPLMKKEFPNFNLHYFSDGDLVNIKINHFLAIYITIFMIMASKLNGISLEHAICQA